jgi:hypothetical protein
MRTKSTRSTAHETAQICPHPHHCPLCGHALATPSGGNVLHVLQERNIALHRENVLLRHALHVLGAENLEVWP